MLDDLFELSFRPILSGLLRMLRAMQFIGWDILFGFLGWRIGWCFYRLISFGRFPPEGIRDQQDADFAKVILIETTGVIILALAFYLLAIFLLGAWAV